MTKEEIAAAREAIFHWVVLAGSAIRPCESTMDAAEEDGIEALDALCKVAQPQESLVGERVRIGQLAGHIEKDSREFAIRLDENKEAGLIHCYRGDFELLEDADA